MIPTEPALTAQNLASARKMLLLVTSMLDENKIPYYLEGGTLLGLVRDKELLPWDHDVDLAAPIEYAPAILKLRFQLLLRGYKLSVRKSTQTFGPVKAGDYSVIKIKPIFGYFIRWFLPKYTSFIVLDLFLKTSDETHTYWQAQGKFMRVTNQYYKTFEEIEYAGHLLKVPNRYCDFLTDKYGNWSVPVKNWNCGEHELTIVKSA